MPNTVERTMLPTTRARHFAGCALALVAASVLACSEHEAVVLDVSDAERVIDYTADDVEVDSAHRISFEPAARFGASSTGRGPLYRPVGFDVDDAGSVHALDNGNKNVVVLGPDGNVVRTLGREGQGPGEITQARGIAVAGGVTYAIVDRARLAAWSEDGDLLFDNRLPTSHPHLDLGAFDDGILISSYSIQPGDPSQVINHYIPQVIATYDSEGRLIRELARTPRVFPTREAGPGERPTSTYAIDRSGRIYVSDGASYDIVAIDADGSRPWHLTVSLPPGPWTDADTERVMAGSRIPGTADDFAWPQVLPSLVALTVDGHGHLFVYRYMRPDPGRTERIVDVFDGDGRHLFSGPQDNVPWRVARGDLVYALEDDEASGGRIVVAYRLIEPFD